MLAKIIDLTNFSASESDSESSDVGLRFYCTIKILKHILLRTMHLYIHAFVLTKASKNCLYHLCTLNCICIKLVIIICTLQA